MRSFVKVFVRVTPLLLPTAVFCEERSADVQPAAVVAIPKDPIVKKVETPTTANAHVPLPPLVAVEDEDAEWEEKKKHCSFCRHFLESPCRLQFKGWSKCVEKCKEEDSDFVEICSSYTRELVACTSSNAEYFKDQGEKVDDEDDESQEEPVGQPEATESVKEKQ